MFGGGKKRETLMQEAAHLTQKSITKGYLQNKWCDFHIA